MDASRRDESPPHRLTARGAATRSRIVQAASQLFGARGVGATTMEEVAAASGSSKSQLYHHFPDKDALIQAVIVLRGDAVLEFHRKALHRVRSIRGLERWRDVVVGRVSAVHGAHGCRLGSLAAEIADDNPRAGAVIGSYIRAWTELLGTSLKAMVEEGQLMQRADPDVLARQIMSALQGGYVLAQIERSGAPMREALDMALDEVRLYRASPDGRSRGPRT